MVRSKNESMIDTCECVHTNGLEYLPPCEDVISTHDKGPIVIDNLHSVGICRHKGNCEQGTRD